MIPLCPTNGKLSSYNNKTVKLRLNECLARVTYMENWKKNKNDFRRRRRRRRSGRTYFAYCGSRRRGAPVVATAAALFADSVCTHERVHRPHRRRRRAYEITAITTATYTHVPTLF